MPSRPRKPVNYAAEQHGTGTPPWLAKSKSRYETARDNDSELEDEDVENAPPSRNNAKSGKSKAAPANSRAAAAANAKGRKRVSDTGDSQHGEGDQGAGDHLQPKAKHHTNSNKRGHEHSDNEDEPVAAKKAKHARSKEQPVAPPVPVSHRALKSLEQLAAEQAEREEGARAQKAKGRSKPGKNGAKASDQLEANSADHADGTKTQPGAAVVQQPLVAAQPAAPAAAPPADAAPLQQAPKSAPPKPAGAVEPAASPAAAPAPAAAAAQPPAGPAGMPQPGPQLSAAERELLRPITAPSVDSRGAGSSAQAFIQLQRKYNQLVDLYQQLKAQKISQLEGLLEEQDEYIQGRQRVLEEQMARWQSHVEEATQRAQRADELAQQLAEAKAEMLRLKQQCVAHEQGALHLQAEVAKLREQLAASQQQLASLQATNMDGGAPATAPAPAQVPNSMGAASAGAADTGVAADTQGAFEGLINLEPLPAPRSDSGQRQQGSTHSHSTEGAGLPLSTGRNCLAPTHHRTVSLQCPTPLVPSPGVGCQYPTPAAMRGLLPGASSPNSVSQNAGKAGAGQGQRGTGTGTPAHGAAPQLPAGDQQRTPAAARGMVDAACGVSSSPAAPSAGMQPQAISPAEVSTSCLATMPSPAQRRTTGSMLTELVAAGVVDPNVGVQVTEAGSCTGGLRHDAGPAAGLLATPCVGSALVQPAPVAAAVAGGAGPATGGGAAAVSVEGVTGEQGSVNGQDVAKQTGADDSPVEGLRETAVPPQVQPQQRQRQPPGATEVQAAKQADRGVARPEQPKKQERAPAPGGRGQQQKPPVAAPVPPPHIRSKPPPLPAQVAPSVPAPAQPAAAQPQLQRETTATPAAGIVLGLPHINTASTPSLVLGAATPATAGLGAAAGQGPPAGVTPLPTLMGVPALAPGLPVNQTMWAGMLDAAAGAATGAGKARGTDAVAQRPAARAGVGPAPNRDSGGSTSVVGPMAAGPATLILPEAVAAGPGAAEGAPAPQQSPQFSFQGSTGLMGEVAVLPEGAAMAAAVLQAAGLRAPTPAAPQGDTATGAGVAAVTEQVTTVTAAGVTVALPAPQALHEVVALMRAATPGRTVGATQSQSPLRAAGQPGSGGGVTMDWQHGGPGPDQDQGMNLAPFDGPSTGAQGVLPATTGAVSAPAAMGGGAGLGAPVPVWQEVFRWEVEGCGERGMYEFHHLDTGLRLSLRRIIVDPALGTQSDRSPTRPTAPADAAVVTDQDLLELVGPGTVLWQYQPHDLGTAGSVLPEYLTDEMEMPEKQAAALMVKISSLLTQVNAAAVAAGAGGVGEAAVAQP